ncbi:ABC transporter permease [uncultured Clostridium sp.]|uniref:ABC transporter permease n=1 Tax=uncultured Clostridium sp. TaxID=59620 RepID=UPI0028EC7469|nr:ABC transporter permease [uncultured Clostridium sp.]
MLFTNTLKNVFRKKSSIIIYFIIPMLSFAASFYIYNSSASTNSMVNVGLINKDNQVLSNDMIEYLKSTKRFKFITGSEDELKDMIGDRKIECIMIIPEDFTKNIYEENPKGIHMYSIKGEQATALIKNYNNIYIKNLMDISKASGGDRNKFNKLYDGYKDGKLKIKEEILEDSSLNIGITYSGIGLLIMFMMFSTGNVSRLMIKERRNRTYYRICASPISSKTYVLSNVLANLFIVFFQVIIILLFITKVIKVNTYVPNGLMMLILVSFGLSAIGIGMVVMAFAKSSAQGSNLTTLITIPTSMLGGCFWETSFMPKTLQRVSNFIPQKWAIEAIDKLQHGMDFKEVFINIIILWAFSLALFLIAIYKMNVDDKVENFV